MPTRLTSMLVVALILVVGIVWLPSANRSTEQIHPTTNSELSAGPLPTSTPTVSMPVDPPPATNHEASSERSPIVELFGSIDHLSREEQETAHRLADVEASRMPVNTYLRWEPVLIEDLYAFVTITETDNGPIYSPREQIRITPFKGTSIVARNTSFRQEDYALSWTGELISGGTGRASVRLITMGVDEKYIAGEIFSDAGVFHIFGIEGSPYTAVLELNPHKPEPGSERM